MGLTESKRIKKLRKDINKLSDKIDYVWKLKSAYKNNESKDPIKNKIKDAMKQILNEYETTNVYDRYSKIYWKIGDTIEDTTTDGGSSWRLDNAMKRLVSCRRRLRSLN